MTQGHSVKFFRSHTLGMLPMQLSGKLPVCSHIQQRGLQFVTHVAWADSKQDDQWVIGASFWLPSHWKRL